LGVFVFFNVLSLSTKQRFTHSTGHESILRVQAHQFQRIR